MSLRDFMAGFAAGRLADAKVESKQHVGQYGYCAYRDSGRCRKPLASLISDGEPDGLPDDYRRVEDGKVVYWYFDRGECPHRGWNAQKACKESRPSNWA